MGRAPAGGKSRPQVAGSTRSLLLSGLAIKRRLRQRQRRREDALCGTFKRHHRDFAMGKGQYKQVGTLTGLTGSPTAIATDSEGNVWATNSPSTTISEFYAGITTPSATYTDSNLTSLSYVAVDKSNNVYVEGQAASSGGIEVDELPYGGKTFTAINAPGQLGYTAGGLAISCPRKPCPIAGNGNVEYLFVNDQGAPSSPATITKWERKRGKLGKAASFQYSGIDTAISVDPFTKDPNDVFAANNVPSGSAFVASGVEYAFPGGNVVSSSPTTSGTFEALDIAISKKP